MHLAHALWAKKEPPGGAGGSSASCGADVLFADRLTAGGQPTRDVGRRSQRQLGAADRIRGTIEKRLRRQLGAADRILETIGETTAESARRVPIGALAGATRHQGNNSRAR